VSVAVNARSRHCSNAHFDFEHARLPARNLHLGSVAKLRVQTPIHAKFPSGAGVCSRQKIYGTRNGWRAFHVERSMRRDERSNRNIERERYA
jgi:hypothetical protein